MTLTELKAKMDALSALLDTLDNPASIVEDWDAIADPRDLFREIYRLHIYEVDGKRPVGTCEWGSRHVRSTPKALYRLLYLLEPKRVDFSDMYKSGSLFAILSPDGEFVADVETYAYELALYFSAAAKHVKGSRHIMQGGRRPAIIVQCGVPGSDNGLRPATGELRQWQKLLLRCVNRRWDMYPGNNFVV